MSLQDSTFTTSRVMDNEIVKASDFEFAFEKLVENVSKATQMILESEQDFVINGKVLPYQGMNVQISPIYGVCKSTGVPFGRTEQAVMEFGFAESTSGRIDIIEVQGDWETYDNQQRAFNDPDTDVKTYQYVDTKKLMRPVFRIKQGTEGTLVAPEVDEGYVKLAEVVIRANNSTIEEEDIKNITADIAGMENEDWTTEATATYNIGYISDVNARFRVAHNEDGTHKEDCIDATMLDIGTGANQVSGNILPVGGAVSIPTETVASTDSILSVITKAASMLTTLYNAYLKYGTYGFKGEFSVSSIADENNALIKPIQLVASGDGTAVIKVNGAAVITIDANGKLSTNGYTATANNHIVTKVVTDAISTALTNLTTRVTNIETTLADNSLYTNKTLSSGTNGRYNVNSLSIVVATTANITLSGTQTIDGHALTVGNNVLVKNQTDAKTNGLYRVESSTWTRVSSYATPAALKGKIFNITKGTSNGGKMFYLPNETFTDSASFGSDNINFVEYFGSIAKVANKVVMRDSTGAANLDVVGNVTGNVTGNVVGNYGSCSTAAGTAEKAVSCDGFTLVVGAVITVKFTTTNTAANPTLNVNSTGAKPIYYRGSAISKGYLAANRTYTFRYDGTSYNFVGDLDTNTTYGGVSKTAAGLCPQLPNETTTTKYLRQDGSWQVPPNTTYSTATTAANGLMAKGDKVNLNAAIKSISRSGTTFTATKVDGTTFTFTQQDNNTTYSTATTAANGLMAKGDKVNLNAAIKSISRSGTTFTATKVDGTTFTFTQQDNNTTYGNATTAAAGLMPSDDKKKINSIAPGIGSVLTCSTESGAAAKTVALANFTLTTGARLFIIFSNANSASNPTLSVNNTTAKAITIGSGASSTTPAAAINDSTKWNGIAANVIYEAYYDGTYWRLTRIDGNLCGIAAYNFGTSGGYIKYTNGLLIQWMKLTDTTTTNNKEFNLYVGYTSFYIPSVSLNVTTNDTDNVEWRHMGVQNSNLNKIIITRMSSTPRFVFCIGY